MNTANNLVKKYVTDVWNQYLEPLNRNPVKFDFRTELGSRRHIPIPDNDMFDILDDLVNNSMAAISFIDGYSGVEIMEEFKPDKVPGKIILRTGDIGNRTIVEVEDNGYGIDPKKICDNAKCLSNQGLDLYKIINYVFTPNFSTKGSPGIGLSDSKLKVEKAGGKIYVAGTTYLIDGKLGIDSKINRITIGEHPGKSTGTIVRMEFPSKPK